MTDHEVTCITDLNHQPICATCASPVTNVNNAWRHGLMINADEYYALNVIAEASRTLLTQDFDENWEDVTRSALGHALMELASAKE